MTISDDELEFLVRMRAEDVRPLKRKSARNAPRARPQGGEPDGRDEVADADALLFEQWVDEMGRSVAPKSDERSPGVEPPSTPAAGASAASSSQRSSRAASVSDDERALFEAWVETTDTPNEREPPTGDESRTSRPNRQKLVRRGEIVPEETCDLHGLKASAVAATLDELFRRASSRGFEVVQLIIGRGLHSRDAPVIPGRVLEWLRDDPLGLVGEVYRAPHHQGGEGALFVFLRRRRIDDET